MSATAECFTVDADKLAVYLADGGSWDSLVAGADRLSYGWSGYVLATLLPYLDEQGVALMESSDGDSVSKALQKTCFALTPEHRRFLDRLDAASFDGQVLRKYYEAFNETSAEGVELAMLDGIRFLQAALGRLRDGTVGLLVIE
jgi:hypothetical protein